MDKELIKHGQGLVCEMKWSGKDIKTALWNEIVKDFNASVKWNGQRDARLVHELVQPKGGFKHGACKSNVYDMKKSNTDKLAEETCRFVHHKKEEKIRRDQRSLHWVLDWLY